MKLDKEFWGQNTESDATVFIAKEMCVGCSSEMNVSSWTLPFLTIKHWVEKIPQSAVISIIQKASVRRTSVTHKQTIRPSTIHLAITAKIKCEFTLPFIAYNKGLN